MNSLLGGSSVTIDFNEHEFLLLVCQGSFPSIQWLASFLCCRSLRVPSHPSNDWPPFSVAGLSGFLPIHPLTGLLSLLQVCQGSFPSIQWLASFLCCRSLRVPSHPSNDWPPFSVAGLSGYLPIDPLTGLLSLLQVSQGSFPSIHWLASFLCCRSVRVPSHPSNDWPPFSVAGLSGFLPIHPMTYIDAKRNQKKAAAEAAAAEAAAAQSATTDSESQQQESSSW